MPAPTFTDLAGRSWRLVLNYGLALDIEQALGVDLANAHNGKALQQLGADPKLFFQTLTMLCEEQLKAADIDERSFLRGFSDETVAEASVAMEQMLLLFTRPALRPVMESLLAKKDQSQQAALELALRKIDSPEAQAAIARHLAEMDNRINRELAQSTGTSSPGNGPASPASIPAATASASSPGLSAAATSSSGTIPAP